MSKLQTAILQKMFGETLSAHFGEVPSKFEADREVGYFLIPDSEGAGKLINLTFYRQGPDHFDRYRISGRDTPEPRRFRKELREKCTRRPILELTFLGKNASTVFPWFCENLHELKVIPDWLMLRFGIEREVGKPLNSYMYEKEAWDSIYEKEAKEAAKERTE